MRTNEIDLDRFRPLTIEEKDRIRQEIVDNCDLVGDCWVWRGAKDSAGYGIKYIQGTMRIVSRFMFCYSTRDSLSYTAHPYDACHTVEICPYRACCNPRHLHWGTHAENCKERAMQKKLSRESCRLEWPSNPQPAL